MVERSSLVNDQGENMRKLGGQKKYGFEIICLFQFIFMEANKNETELKYLCEPS